MGLLAGLSVAEVVPSKAVHPLSTHSNLRGCFMGDKSPKSKDRQKKQDTAGKSQKASAAAVKAKPAPAVPAKKGK